MIAERVIGELLSATLNAKHKFGEHQARMQAAEAAVQEVAGLRARVGTLEGEKGALQACVTSLEVEAAALRERLGELVCELNASPKADGKDKGDA